MPLRLRVPGGGPKGVVASRAAEEELRGNSQGDGKQENKDKAANSPGETGHRNEDGPCAKHQEEAHNYAEVVQT